jgi:hypothetical protein
MDSAAGAEAEPPVFVVMFVAMVGWGKNTVCDAMMGLRDADIRAMGLQDTCSGGHADDGAARAGSGEMRAGEALARFLQLTGKICVCEFGQDVCT